MTVSSSAEGQPPQRDEKGRFLQGNKAAVGNKGGAFRGDYRQKISAFSEIVTPEAWAEVIKQALAEAQGRVPGARSDAARAFLARYVAPETMLKAVVGEAIRDELRGPFGWSMR